jgi:3'-phosphoadenosine 5'-phosphosulfate sulfotransferase (PAPS reductase)/FAD synthetase
MDNPFQIDGPAVISFSGGRTSAYLLRRALDAHGGTLPSDVHVLFADTGQEHEATYAFVREVAARWAVEIVWVERPGQFTQLITDKKFLPNPIARFCTQELKLAPMRAWMLARGYDHWTNVVGIRADEPRRVAKMRAQTYADRWDIALPLADAGVTVDDVMAFWAASPFDLGIAPLYSNCVGCFLKGYDKLRNIARERPDQLAWWAEQEARIGGTFRNDRPKYADMLAQGDLFQHADESLIECFCTD